MHCPCHFSSSVEYVSEYIPSVPSGEMLSYSSAVIFDILHKAHTIWRRVDAFALPSYQREHIGFSKSKLTQHYCLSALILLYIGKLQSRIDNISFSFEAVATIQLFSFLVSLLLRGQLTEEHYPSDRVRGRKKKKNLNKYFIRLFCDLMCLCLTRV